jgi:hypothetical protein
MPLRPRDKMLLTMPARWQVEFASLRLSETRLGQGAEGAVYEALTPDGLLVAIK